MGLWHKHGSLLTCDLFALRGQVFWPWRVWGFLQHLLFQSLFQLTACLNCRTEEPLKISFCLENKSERLNLMWKATRPSNCFLQKISCNHLELFSLDWKLAVVDVFEVKSFSLKLPFSYHINIPGGSYSIVSSTDYF